MIVPSISVIVPCYMVERYLQKCIESIISQTVNDIEIIIVNDGSPDRSGVIADQLAMVDKRIKVIHKTNGGLSSARNAGLLHAKGKYITFIDSDDWIEPFFLQDLLTAAIVNDADISICGLTVDFLIENVQVKINVEESSQYLDPCVFGDLFLDLHQSKLFNYAWNKLYKRSFLETYRLLFELDGMPAEDLFFNIQAFMYASVIATVKNNAYHYIRQDHKSILASYQPHLFEIDQRRLRSYEGFFKHFRMINNKCFVESMRFSLACGQINNIFKQDAPLSFSSRLKWIDKNIYSQRRDLISIAHNISILNAINRIFVVLLKLNSAFIMTITYTFLFNCRYMFSNLYLKVRKNLNK